MHPQVKEFNEYRSKMNDLILSKDNLVIKRLYNLDANTYAEGALPVKTKEMLGLVASMVLRCDDCIKYHLEKSFEAGVSRDVRNICGSQYCWRNHSNTSHPPRSRILGSITKQLMLFSEEEIASTIKKLIFGLTYKNISSENETLVESGILSSITITELAVELEKSFSVSISFMEINKENFNTLANIKNLILKKLA